MAADGKATLVGEVQRSTSSLGVWERWRRWARSFSERWPWASLSVAFSIAVAGLGASVLIARQVTRSDADTARLRFRAAAAQIASTLELAIQHEQDLVVDTSAFVARDPDVSKAHFERWLELAQAPSRYPELQNIGVVELVAGAHLHAFEARLAAPANSPHGPRAPVQEERFQVMPPGRRPYYCFSVVGWSRSAAVNTPDGTDFCALAPQLIQTRVTGQELYAPLGLGAKALLAIETPVYRTDPDPATTAARQRQFLGWLGEIVQPGVLLAEALQAHPGVGVRFQYDAAGLRVAFAAGRVPAHAQSAATDLHNGWTVRSFAAATTSGILADPNSRELFLAGALLSALAGALALVLTTGRRRACLLVQEKTCELSHLALHDPLTGLPNRLLVLDRAEQMLARARRTTRAVTALCIDVDRFKKVNDTFGHAAGDAVLRLVAGRLASVIRDEDTAARVGGDEFVVLADGSEHDDRPALLAARLLEVLRKPYDLRDQGIRTLPLTVSIGVACGIPKTPDELLRDADLALYAAKQAGRNQYIVFDHNAQMTVSDKHILELDLADALAASQFFLVYQPIMDLRSQCATGVEALIRWQHPVRGVVMPSEFIPIAEETGMIEAIGRWVLETACQQAAKWHQAGHRLFVAVNVSVQQLGSGRLIDDVKRILQSSQLPAHDLTLEVTESGLMRDHAETTQRLSALKQIGVRIAIDDFGTGYSSLSYLLELPADILKIDRSFIADITSSAQSMALMHMLTQLGETLGLETLAEGIEEQTQLEVVHTQGCDLGQGFYFSRPLDPRAIEQLLSADPRMNLSPLNNEQSQA